MPDSRFIDEDFVALRRERNARQRPFLTLAYGDAVEVLRELDGWTEVRALDRFNGRATGFVRGRPRLRDRGVLKFSMVDVQQGDGLILETPEGRVVFIDGGDNQLFARHAAARFRHREPTPEAPLDVDLILVTHGDADHFDGLNELRRSEELPQRDARKRLPIRPRRIYHSGLVKGPSALAETDQLGATVERGDELFVVDLVDDPRELPAAARNQYFDHWVTSLDHWERRGPIAMRRLAFGMDEGELFGFLADEGIGVEIQGPFTSEVEVGGATVPALPFLHEPERSAELHLEAPADPGGSLSTSHTINGHSVALRLTFGNVRFQLTGDLNREAMALMRRNLPMEALEAEIVKAPHHGSHDFDFQALRHMAPVVAIVSSGDESAFREYVHPRATLMAALGKVMRGDTGVVLCTELAAFFAYARECYRREDLADFFRDRAEETFTGDELRQLFTGIERPGDPPGMFDGFERLSFGIIHVRTDGERMLVFTHTGREGLHEAYRFTVTLDDGGGRKVDFAPEVETR